MRRCVLSATGPQVVEVCEREHVPELDAFELRPLLLVLDEDAHGVRVPEDVGAVARRARGVHRRADGADQGEREVEERPLEPRRAEDPERVALADPERKEAVRDLLHRSSRLSP